MFLFLALFLWAFFLHLLCLPFSSYFLHLDFIVQFWFSYLFFVFIFFFGYFSFFILYFELTNYNSFLLRNKLIQAFVSFVLFFFIFFVFIFKYINRIYLYKNNLLSVCVYYECFFCFLFWFPVCIFPLSLLFLFLLIKMNTYKNCCVSFVPYRFFSLTLL